MPTRHVRHSENSYGSAGRDLSDGRSTVLQQLPARYAEPADRALFIEMRHEIGDRRVDVRQAVKGSVTQPPEQPSLDDEHGLLNLGFVPGPPRPRRQNGGSVMRRHFGIGPIDLRIVKAGLDDGGLRIVRHKQLRDAADRLERAHMGVDPVGERLRPARVREGEARGAEHGDEDLRHADFPGEPVNDDRDPVARVIDEQPFARRVRLPHRRRQLRFKAAIEFAKPRIAVTAGVGRDIFVPDDQQSDVLALQLSMDRGPIRLGMAAVSPFASAIGVKRRLQFGVADPLRQRPRKPSALQTT